jgi:hypothetical protein
VKWALNLFTAEDAEIRRGYAEEKYKRSARNLPMINEKKTSELIETSLIYLLSAAVAVGAFVLVWLVSFLLGFGQA